MCVAALHLKDIKDMVSAIIHLEKYWECETMASLEAVSGSLAHGYQHIVQLHSYKHAFLLNGSAEHQGVYVTKGGLCCGSAKGDENQVDIRKHLLGIQAVANNGCSLP